MSKIVIPRKSIYRLSVYQRCLQRLKANEVERVSSEALARAAGVKPTQLRKDLTYFGQFGTRGLGYNVEALSRKITEVLGTAKLQPVVLIGVGNLGSALLRYQGFNKEGFEIVAGFDSDPAVVEAGHSAATIHPMKECASFIRKNNIKVAIMCLPAKNTQEVANMIVESGVQAILNFAPIILQTPENVVVNNVDLALELENLSYFIR